MPRLVSISSGWAEATTNHRHSRQRARMVPCGIRPTIGRGRSAAVPAMPRGSTAATSAAGTTTGPWASTWTPTSTSRRPAGRPARRTANCRPTWSSGRIKDANGHAIPCGVHLRPFRKGSWYHASFDHAHRWVKW